LKKVKRNEHERIEAKKLRDKSIEEKRKNIDLNILEKDKSKQILNKSKVEEQEKQKKQIAKVLKKKWEIENQKYLDDSQKIKYKCKF